MLQDRAYLCNLNHLIHRADDFINIGVFALIVADQFTWEDPVHRNGSYLTQKNLYHTVDFHFLAGARSGPCNQSCCEPGI